MNKAIILVLLTPFAGTVYAGSGKGKVGSIWTSPTSPSVMFNFNMPIEDTPVCNRSERFSIDIRAIGGQATFETLLMAKSQGLTVSVEGLGTCNIHDAENVKAIETY
jgi:hypothetical protein